MSEQVKTKFTRRNFIGISAVGLAGVTFLPSLTSCLDSGKKEYIRLGFIGLGQQAMYLLNGFIQIPGVRVVAGCDVYGRKNQRFVNRVNKFYTQNKVAVEVKMFEKYQDLLACKEIDAVVIATPDHTHAMIAIAACKAGKDVYLEKPMTFTIKEGQELRKVVRELNRVLAIGSHQRSDIGFQYAVKLVQDGIIGKIEKVNAYVGAPPKPYTLPEETIPSDLNWDLWLGPLPSTIHYNNELNPPISLDPVQNEKFWGGWRWYKETGGGFTTDWGAHMFDVVQWALKMDKSGPVEISPIGDDAQFISYKYANGVIMTSEPFNESNTKGVKFHGDKGWIEVSRGHFKTSDNLTLPPRPEKVEENAPLEKRIPHLVNFIESIKDHKDPVVPVEIGHRSCTVCTLGNIACDLGRTIKWDPDTETFVDDQDGKASAKMHYQYRDGWTLL